MTKNINNPIATALDEHYVDETDHIQLISRACKYFCDGLRAVEMLRKLKAEFPELTKDAKRESPMQWVREGAQKGWLKYDPPHENVMQQALADAFNWDQNDIVVVQSKEFDHVALAGAERLLRMIRKTKKRRKTDEVHVGFAGGRQLQLVAKNLAELLKTWSDANPKTIVLHAMVAAFGEQDYGADPNTFMGYFDEKEIKVEIRFVQIFAPGIVETDLRQELRKAREINHAYEAAEKLDIIVSGGGDWEDEHSTSQHYLKKVDPQDVEALKAECAIGDLLWQPLAKDGPIDLDAKGKFKFRPNTVVDLKSLPDRIRNGTGVLLALGPCGACGKPKGKLLDTIMSLEEPYVTQIVTDSATAHDALQRSQGATIVAAKKAK